MATVLDLFHPIDALRLWLCLGTLDLLRNVGRIEELLALGIKGHRDLATEPARKRILGRVGIWAVLSPVYLMVAFVAMLLWPMVLGSDLRTGHPINWNQAARPTRPFAPRWRELKERLTIEQAEARERVHDPLGAVPDVPFGFLNPAWQQFVAARQPGDRLRRFESPRRKLGETVVQGGYAWVRRFGKVRTAWVAALRHP